MTGMGLVFGVLLASALLFQRPRLVWLIALSAAFSTVAVVAGNGIPGFYATGLLVVLALIAAAAQRYTSPDPEPIPPRPGSVLLAVFVVWAVLMTLLGPDLFAGIGVLQPRAGIDVSLTTPQPLGYTVSNFAQTAYVVLGAAIVFYLARQRDLPRLLFLPSQAIPTVLTSVEWVTLKAGVPWPSRFFDANPNVRIVDTFTTGQTRFRGLASEPSGLATLSIVACTYFVALAYQARGRRRAVYLLLAGLAFLNLVASEAGTAVVAGVLVGVAAVVYLVVTVAAGAKRGAGLLIVGAPLAAGLVLWQWAPIYSYASSIVSSKVGSHSYFTRLGADRFTLGLLTRTYGLGTGLGSNRPSTFLPGLLGTVGVVGAGLFLLAVAVIVRRAWRRPEWRPTAAALAALIVCKCVAGSDLSNPTLWLALGCCAYAAWSQPRAATEEPTTLAPRALSRV